MTVAELAAATGLHPNTTREHLQRLISAGFVSAEPEHHDAKGRPNLRYQLAGTVHGPEQQVRVDAAMRRASLVRTLLHLEPRAGEDAVARQLDVLDDHLDQCGFDSEIEPDSLQVRLHDCPFGALAKANPQVCQVHLALAQAALAQGDGPLEVESVHPFLSPGLCTLDLRMARDAS